MLLLLLLLLLCLLLFCCWWSVQADPNKVCSGSAAMVDIIKDLNEVIVAGANPPGWHLVVGQSCTNLQRRGDRARKCGLTLLGHARVEA